MKQTRKITNVLIGAGFILLLCLVFITSRAAQDCPRCVPPPDGLVSWWDGEGDANDIVDGNHGTLYFDATFDTGMVDQAFSFDGFEDYVDIPDSSSLDLGTQLSIDAWFKTDNVDKIDPGGTNTATQCIVMYGWDPADGKNNPLHIRNGVLFFAVRGYGIPYEDLVGITPVLSNVWYHAALTYDGITAKLYLNGNLEDLKNVDINMNTNSKLLIGRYQNPLNKNFFFDFDGLIDEVELYNRALSQAEIQAIFNAGCLGKCRIMQVDIDIKPGSYPNAINLGSQGVIPVAILSSADFDATNVDPDTVELAGSGVAVRGKSNKSMAHFEDVNGDFLIDLVVQVETENLDPSTFQDGCAVLTGETYDGVLFEGVDEITIVPD